jgi:hypothetical protein
MKTRSKQAKQMFGKISREVAAYRDAFRAWLDAAASKLFPIPAPVRIVNRQQYQRLRAAQSRRQQN